MKKTFFLIGICFLTMLTAAVAEKLETTTFSLTYEEPWVFDKAGEDYAILYQGTEDEKELSVDVSIRCEDVKGYRSALYYAGVDAFDLIENHVYETVEIAGCSCVQIDNASGSEYIGREENKSLTMHITVDGDSSDETVKALLDGLTIIANDEDNRDYPWYWEGERFSGDGCSVDTDRLHLHTELIPFENAMVINEPASGRIGIAGDSIYVLMDKKLYRFADQDGRLVQLEEINTDTVCTELVSDRSEIVYVSGMGRGQTVMFDSEGRGTELNGAKHLTAVNPSGKWGIDWIGSNTPVRFAIENGKAVEGNEITVPEDLRSITRVFVTDHYIALAGTSAETGRHAVFVLDTEGNLCFKLGDKDFDEEGMLAYVYAFAETSEGIITFDGNMKYVVFWDHEGNWLGTVDGKELFGTDYAWMTGSTAQEDGSVLVCMKQERADHSADELLVYRLTGFGSTMEITEDQEIETENTAKLRVVNCKRDVNMRKEPNTDCEVLAKVPKDTEVADLGVLTENFYKVDYDGLIGYISADYLEKVE